MAGEAALRTPLKRGMQFLRSTSVLCKPMLCAWQPWHPRRRTRPRTCRGPRPLPQVCSGLAYFYSVYAPAIKERLGLTQVQIASAGSAGARHAGAGGGGELRGEGEGWGAAAVQTLHRGGWAALVWRPQGLRSARSAGLPLQLAGSRAGRWGRVQDARCAGACLQLTCSPVLRPAQWCGRP